MTESSGKNAHSPGLDFAMHFRTKDESLTELYFNESPTGSDVADADIAASKESKPDCSKYLGLKTLGNKGSDSSVDEEYKLDKNVQSCSSDVAHGHSMSPSEYKKMFKNLNEFTEKITRTVEEKISVIKSDINSSRTRILSSKENSSVSDSEDNSDNSRLSESPKKFHKPSEGVAGITEQSSPVKDFLNALESEFKRKKSDVSSEIVSVAEEHEGRVVSEEENVEVHPAVEAQEDTRIDESENEENYLDARDTVVEDDFGSGGEPPGGSESSSIINFVMNPTHQRTELSAAVVLASIIIVPLPSFLRGFLCCLFLVIIWFLFKEYMKTVIEFHPFLPRTKFAIPDYNNLQPLNVPLALEVKGVWFNEYTYPYDPEFYSVSQTVPVYLELQDSQLILSRPKGKIGKKAVYEERRYKLDFINRRIYDLRHCRVCLLPEGIIRRRFFSRKYPIFIELGSDSLVKAVKLRESSVEEEEIDVEQTYKTSDSTRRDSRYGKHYLNLFARCNRQKEEWFRKLKAATKISQVKDGEPANGASTPFENISFDIEMAEYEEYWEYMNRFIGEAQYHTKVWKTFVYAKAKSNRKKGRDIPVVEENWAENRRKHDGFSKPKNGKMEKPGVCNTEESLKSTALGVEWLNAFINRFLFDVFRSPYLLNKIKSKAQKKLSTLRLPYYIEALEIIELNLGKVGPRFHRISPPLLDGRGLWLDMDMTFDGSMKVILQTQLNLIKLQKGLEDEVEQLPDKPETSTPSEKSDSKQNTNANAKRKEKARKDGVSSEQLLLEFAEIAIAEESHSEKENCYKKDQPAGSNDDDDVDDSESSESEDDDDEEETVDISTELTEGSQEAHVEPKRIPRRKSSKRIFRVMETVAQSKYFKHIAETKYMQKAIAGVSATKLRLVLEIKSCIGTLVVNFPPPPNDRIWYCFRNIPKLWMSAQPKVGEKFIRSSHIRRYVEKKIMDEIKKVIVFPNMDDVLLPLSPDDLSMVLSKILAVNPSVKAS